MALENQEKIVISLNDIDILKKTIDYFKSNHSHKIIYIDLSLNNKMYSYMEAPERKIYENLSYFKKIQSEHIPIYFFYEEKIFSLDKVLEDEYFLNHLTNEIENCHFSPLEKHVALYSIVKNFKPYKKEEIQMSLHTSRSLYEYLNNSYFVCAGAINLYANLASRLGIPVESFVLLTDIFKGKAHARNYIHIEDKKYKISGYFITDPTARDYNEEKELEDHFFSNMLITTNDNKKEVDYSFDRFFQLKNEELYKYLNEYPDASSSFFKMIENLDKPFYYYVKKLDLKNEHHVYQISHYLEQKINQPFSKLILLDALIEVKKHIYKNFSLEDFENLKKYYLENAVDLQIERRK